MSALTCGFCGRISTQTKGWRQIFTRSLDDHDDESNFMCCPKCHGKIIDDNLGTVVDPELQFEAVRESLEDSDPARDFIGLPLRDFLCSGMYLQTQNIYFTDKFGIIVTDYMECMDARVLKIDKRDTHGRRQVTLDIAVP